MTEKKQPNRWRCLAKGCNPILNERSAQAHKSETGHRVAKWPVRSSEGIRKAVERNKSGYYDKYNVGPKSFAARGLGGFGGVLDTPFDDRYDEDDGSWDSHGCFTG